MKFLTRHGLWVVLALALAVRLSPMLFERQITHDAIEYQNIAENLRAGRGFMLDIKAYWAEPTPVVHYGFYERPILLPALLALLRFALPPLAASQVIGPLLFLLALALIYQTVRREVGPEAALSAGLLLALQPSLHELSLYPLTEATTLLATALILWSHFRMRSPILTGIACSLAFLARPSMLLFSMIMGLVYLVESFRMRQPLRVIAFAGLALVGPLWTATLNRAMGVPLTLLPQSFLFRVLSYSDQMQFFHRGSLYASGADLLRAHWADVARLLAKNALYYFKAAIETDGMGLLLALTPVALAGLAQGRPLRRYFLLLLFIAADLGLYLVTWSTFDPLRFLSLSYLLGIVLIVLGTHEVLDREPLLKTPRAWVSGASYAFLIVAAVWLVIDAGRGYLAFREWQLGRPINNYLEASWTAPGVESLARQLNAAREKMAQGERLPVVASNEPWLIWDKTRLPAGKLPYDLEGAEWLNLIDNLIRADLVVIHRGDWPAEYHANLEDLAEQLKAAGWWRFLDEGQIQAWMRPDKK